MASSASVLRALGQLARDLGVDAPLKVAALESDDAVFSEICDTLAQFGCAVDVSRVRSVGELERLVRAEFVDVVLLKSGSSVGKPDVGVPVVEVSATDREILETSVRAAVAVKC